MQRTWNSLSSSFSSSSWSSRALMKLSRSSIFSRFVSKVVSSDYHQPLRLLQQRQAGKNRGGSALVSSMILLDSARRSSYVLVPATSLSKWSRSWSFWFVRWVIYAGPSLSAFLPQSSSDRRRETHPALGDDVVGVAPAEACALEDGHDFALAGRLAVELVLVLLEADRATEEQCRLVYRGKSRVNIAHTTSCSTPMIKDRKWNALVGNRPSELSNSISTNALMVAPPPAPPPSCRRD